MSLVRTPAALSRTALVVCAFTLSLSACKKTDSTVAPKAKVPKTFNFHALSGISMGGIGAAFLAGSKDASGNPNYKRIDAIAPLGGPIDVAYFLGGFERMQVGGFCPLDKLKAYDLSHEPSVSAKLNDPNEPGLAECSKPNKPLWNEHAQNFNHWQYTTSGGHFDRDSYLDIFYDLTLALGNPFYYNPESPIFPGPGITKANFNSDLCAHPKVYSKKNTPPNPIYNAEYNPTGDYDVITFCDGESPIIYCTDTAKTPYDYCSGKTSAEFCAALGATPAEVGNGNVDANPELYWARKGTYTACAP